MSARIYMRRVLVIGSCVALTASGCGFDGLNSLPLPGAVGRGSDADIYHVEIANVSTLESNSPVMIDDVSVGSVGKIGVRDWHANVEVSVRHGVVVPANAIATIGQTSLLGSMHLQLNPPIGEKPAGRLEPGSTVALSKSSTYPSTEQTLSSLSAVVNGGGLGQFGDIIHNFNAAFSGRQGQIRDLLSRLDTFVGTFDAQRDNLIASMQALNRLAGTLATQRDVIDRALQRIPAALEVLTRERPRITTALEKLRVFSDTATGLINGTHADLVKNLHNLEPAIRALADVGPDLDTALAYLPVFPNGQTLIDRGVRGDYMNQYVVVDITVPRLKRGLFLGTRWGQEGVALVPAPGEPQYDNYSRDPLSMDVAPPPPLVPPPADEAAPEPNAAPMPAERGPILPVSPPPPPGSVLTPAEAVPAAPAQQGIFAGPYGPPLPTPSQGPPPPAGDR